MSIEAIQLTVTATGALVPTVLTPERRAQLEETGHRFTYDDERQRIIATPRYFGAARVFAY